MCEKTICDKIFSRDSRHGVPYDRLVTVTSDRLKTEDDCPSIIDRKARKTQSIFLQRLGVFALNSKRVQKRKQNKKEVTEKRTLSYLFAFIIEKQQERKV